MGVLVSPKSIETSPSTFLFPYSSESKIGSHVFGEQFILRFDDVLSWLLIGFYLML
jgi:hypothetical protein